MSAIKIGRRDFGAKSLSAKMFRDEKKSALKLISKVLRLRGRLSKKKRWGERKSESGRIKKRQTERDVKKEFPP